MAWQLVAEVLNHAPRELTAGERLVLVAIAEQVHQDRWRSRQVSIGAEDLQRLTGMHKSSLKAALRRLQEQRGLRVRVVSVDDNGHPVYAHNGESARFRVPELPAPPGCSCNVCKGACAATSSRDEKGALPATPSLVKGVRPAAPSQNGKGARPAHEGGALRDLKGARPATPYREPNTGGRAHAPAHARGGRSRSLCGRHDDFPERPCRECERRRHDAEARDSVRLPPPPPVCGECEGRDGEPAFTRLLPGTSQPCPRCHPAHLNGAAVHAS